jgi:hypothetical protein
MFERDDVIYFVWHQDHLLRGQATFATACCSLEDAWTEIRGHIRAHGNKSSLIEAQQGLSFCHSHQMLQVLILLPITLFIGCQLG